MDRPASLTELVCLAVTQVLLESPAPSMRSSPVNAATQAAGSCFAQAAAVTGMRAGAGGTARPSGRSAPASSNTTTPLHSRLHPCSGWLATARAAMRSVARASGHCGQCGQVGSLSGRADLGGASESFMAPPIAQSTYCRAAVPAGRSRAGGRCPHTWQQRPHRAATAASRYPPSGRKSPPGMPGRLLGLLEPAALTEHVNAMGAARSPAAGPISGPRH
jgi:hypothetical protein